MAIHFMHITMSYGAGLAPLISMWAVTGWAGQENATLQAGLADALLDNISISDYTPAECGRPGVMEYMAQDLNEDCYIGFADFGILAQGWLDCTEPTDPSCNQYWK